MRDLKETNYFFLSTQMNERVWRRRNVAATFWNDKLLLIRDENTMRSQCSVFYKKTWKQLHKSYAVWIKPIWKTTMHIYLYLSAPSRRAHIAT